MILHSGIIWRYAELTELRPCCPADGGRWLGPRELRHYARFKDQRRREGWLLGRVLAKQLLLENADTPVGEPREIEIISRDSQGRAVRPEVTVGGRRQPWSLSISHTDTAVLAAVCFGPAIGLGVDLVRLQPLGRGFVQAWFDRREQALLGEGGLLEACTLWAAKEAVYKAAGSGDSFAPRQIRLRLSPLGGYTCTYRGVDLSDNCRVRTWTAGGHVAALAVVTGDTAQREAVEPAIAEIGGGRTDFGKHPIKQD